MEEIEGRLKNRPSCLGMYDFRRFLDFMWCNFAVSTSGRSRSWGTDFLII